MLAIMLPGPPKACRMIAFYGFWAIILPTLGGLGNPDTDTNKALWLGYGREELGFVLGVPWEGLGGFGFRVWGLGFGV